MAQNYGKLPKAVQQQAEAAKKAQKAIIDASSANANVTVHNPDIKKPEESVMQQPEPEIQAEPQAQPVSENWEHKYNVLKGKYDKEIPDLRSQLNRAMATVENLNSLILATSQNLPQETRQPEGGNGEGRRQQQQLANLDVNKWDGYGEEMTELVNVVNNLIAENNTLRGQLGQVAKKTEASEMESYFAVLDEACPDWETVNKDPGFLAWLQQPDEMTGGYPRISILKAHEARRNAKGVASFFTAWKTITGAELKGNEPKVSQTQKGNPLAGQVVPEGAAPQHGAPQGNTNPAPRIVTPKEFSEASKLMAMGRMDPKEFRKIQIAFQQTLRGGPATP